jgi:hypothetical protein
VAENTAKKQRGRPFSAGRSGNPAGKPQGALNRATTAAQALLDGEAEALTRKAVELALEGNMAALKLCLERLVPPRKERPLSLALPDVSGADALPKLTAALLAAVSRGELTAGEAGALSQLAANHGKALESAELERRIAALEKYSVFAREGSGSERV